MKRGGDTPTRSSRQNKRACNGGETTESFIAGDLHEDCNQHVCSELSDEVASDLHRSVVSIALSKGNKVVFACSGIALQWRGFSTRFLTSVSLVRALFDAREGVRHHIAIEVRHEGDKVHTGFLAEYSFQHNWAVVVVVAELDVHIALLRRAEEVLPHSSVMALGRDTTGKIITRSVILTNDLSLSEGPERVVSPTCDVCEVQVCQGGPLFYSDGSFVGMNLCLAVEATYFLQWSIILERLERYWTISRRKKAFPLKEILKAAKLRMRPRHNSVCRDVSNEEQFRGLDSMGYPKQPKVGMFLANNFEETFGNKYDEGVWSLLMKKASSNVNRNVVALASFNGETRFFACTGFFIEWDGRTVILTSASLVRNSDDENKIKENLKIQVFVQSNRCIQGTLEHYDLHYNVALVGVKDYRVLRPAIAQPDFMKCTSRLLAVGRCFKSGTLMASCGLLTDWTGRLDCKYLYYSSCKTTKAGIGGPLVDLEGRFLGMNFYDKKIEGTPFLVWNDILKVLAHFKETRTETEVVNGGASYWTFERDRSKQMNRWPVPKPHWRYGCKRDKVESQDEDAMKKSGTSFRQGRGRYGYINGMRYLYL